MSFLTKVQATKKTFADYLFEGMEEAKKEVADIETAVRNEFKDKPEIDVLQEIAYRVMKNNKIPSGIKSKAMDVYDKMK
jgi:hypothetical protein